MPNDDTTAVPEGSGTSVEIVNLHDPIHAGLRKEQKERAYINGCEIVASGTILLQHGDVGAIKPFMKSKTGPTIEFRFVETNSVIPRMADTKVYSRGSTTRFDLVNWQEEVVLPPFKAATYRSRQIMAIVDGRETVKRSRIWALTYTFFYSFNSEPKPWS